MSCHTYEWAMLQTWSSCVYEWWRYLCKWVSTWTQLRKLWHVWVKSHVGMRLHVWMSHVTNMNVEDTCVSAWVHRPTQSIVYVPVQVNRFQESILLIVQYKHLTSCSKDFILQNLILRIISCGAGFITQSSWVFHFHLTIMVRWKFFAPQLYQLRRGISEGPALK